MDTKKMELVKAYQNLARKIITSAKNDILPREERKQIITWLRFTREDDVKIIRLKRRRYLKMLRTDREARKFFRGEGYRFWNDIIDADEFDKPHLHYITCHIKN